jgi:ribulose-5-phosphate 4-epimerase/fuculose-1-phosphate aldolase
VGPSDLALRSIKDDIPAAEWQTRVDLAACYRLVAHYGMTDMIANHISARVPGHPEQFLINAYGLLYEEITASSLIRIDIDGNILWKPDFDYGFNRAGFVVHSAIHGARHDVDCVVHTHTAVGMAVSAMSCGLLPMTQTAMRFSTIAYHDYEGVAVELDERQRLVRDLGSAEVMILRNHGLLATGASIPEAFSNIWRLELACAAQIAALSCTSDVILPPRDVIERTNHLYRPNVRRPWGVLEWPALLRLLDRRDGSYRQ